VVSDAGGAVSKLKEGLGKELAMNESPDDLTMLTPIRAAFGREMAHWRKLRAMKQAGLALRLARGGWIGTCSQPYIAQIERGRKIPPIGIAEGADTILETGGILLRLWPWVDQEAQLAGGRRYRQRGVAPVEAGWEMVATPIQAHTDAGDDALLIVVCNGRVSVMRRREFLRSGAAFGGAVLLGPALETLGPEAREELSVAVQSAAADRPHKLSMKAVNHMRRLLAETRQLDDLVGPKQLLNPIEGQLAMAEQLRRGAEGEALAALLSLTGQLAQFAGWLCLDSGDHAKARHYNDRALSLAVAANDLPLGSYVLSCGSFQAYEANNPAEALLLAQAAQAQHWQPTPAVLAWALRTEGYAHALKGDADTCQGALDRAAEVLTTSKPDDEPPWIYHFRLASFPVYRGFCFTHLGRGPAAVAALTDGLAALPEEFLRDRAAYLARLADAHRLNNEMAQAGVVAQQATLLAMETGSVHTHRDLQRLWSDLGAVRDVAEVHQFGALLRDASSTSPACRQEATDEQAIAKWLPS
jgi:hypothetical protein